jgi:hypothetical protein
MGVGSKHNLFVARLLALLIAAVSFVASCAVADELVDGIRRQTEAYRQKLESLARWCESQGLTEEAERTRRWLHPVLEDRLLVPILPRKMGTLEPPEGESPVRQEWYRRWAALRKEQADALFALARGAIRQGRAALALDLALAALHENPDHEGLRRLFGFQAYSGYWRTAYEVRRLRAGDVWHERFGWLPKGYVARYEQGERFYQNRWISAEEERRLRSSLQNGWVVETEHYRVLTNHSLEEGVRLAEQFERLNEVWSRLFIRFYTTDAQIRALFDLRNRPPVANPVQHRIVLFRNREEYNAALKSRYPQVELSVGLYDGATRCCYFFSGPGFDASTAYHEATHQLFQEVGRSVPNPGFRCNYWVIEGAAMYLETLRQEGDFFVLGGIDTPRLLAARVRFLQDRFYIPLEKFCSLGMEEFQTDSRIGALYSQAAGLTQFFMHFDGGRYRDALVNFLATVYLGRDNPSSLSQLTGVRFSQLDEQYAAYMRSLPNLPMMRIEEPTRESRSDLGQ